MSKDLNLNNKTILGPIEATLLRTSPDRVPKRPRSVSPDRLANLDKDKSTVIRRSGSPERRREIQKLEQAYAQAHKRDHKKVTYDDSAHYVQSVKAGGAIERIDKELQTIREDQAKIMEKLDYIISRLK